MVATEEALDKLKGLSFSGSEGFCLISRVPHSWIILLAPDGYGGQQ